MRVAYVVHRFPSQPPAVMNQVTGLIDRGVSVELFALGEDWTGPKHGLYEDYDLNSRATWFKTPHPRWLQRTFRLAHAMPSSLIREPRATLHALQAARAWPKQRGIILHYLQEIRGAGRPPYDVIHCQWGDIGNICLPAKFLWKGKLVVSFRGRDFHALPVRHGAGIYAKMFDAADAITVVSEQGRAVLLKLGCPPEKLVTHFSGTQVRRIPFLQRRLSEGQPVRVISVGRLLEMKGFHSVIKAMRTLKSENQAVEYHIVGDGETRERLRALAVDLGVDDLVHFHGRRSWEEVVQLMLDCHICVVPSLNEGLPGVLMEAAATGLPIVASDAGGISEGMLAGESGYLVPPGDSAALAERLLELVRHPEAWSAMGAAGRKHVETHFDIEVLNDRLVHFYRHVASGRPAAEFPASSAASL